jgi:hypothetical protein
MEDVFASRTDRVAEPPQAHVAEPPRPPERPPEPSAAVDYDAGPPTPLGESETAAKTIDDQPELVAAFAEPGAEDGASAEVEVDEPWDGYDNLSADQVVERIGRLGAAELAVTELYERTHKDRLTVLEAAERRQRGLANAPD